jgi:hypothetical protein
LFLLSRAAERHLNYQGGRQRQEHDRPRREPKRFSLDR